jgi:predicted RNA binding protein YcfA (HicA-like mRNA interferase family)
MSKLPRITGEQAVTAFARAGFVVDRTKGGPSHS